MPEELWPRAEWLRDRLESKLSEAKMWPVKLHKFEHQASLSSWAYKTSGLSHATALSQIACNHRGQSMQTHAADLESSYHQLQSMIRVIVLHLMQAA